MGLQPSVTQARELIIWSFFLPLPLASTLTWYSKFSMASPLISREISPAILMSTLCISHSKLLDAFWMNHFSLCLKKLSLKNHLFIWNADQQMERSISCVVLLAKWLQHVWLGQAKARSRKLLPGLIPVLQETEHLGRPLLHALVHSQSARLEAEQLRPEKALLWDARVAGSGLTYCVTHLSTSKHFDVWIVLSFWTFTHPPVGCLKCITSFPSSK